MAGYTKLFESIVRSSVWDLDSDTTKVWVTMMALADRDGVVEASVPGLAHEARVPLAKTQQALDLFLSPDPYSRTPDHEGRRIVVVRGGWRLLNHAYYRGLMSQEDQREKTRERVRRHREKKKQGDQDVTPDVTLCNGCNDIEEAEAESDTKEQQTTAKVPAEPLQLSHPKVKPKRAKATDVQQVLAVHAAAVNHVLRITPNHTQADREQARQLVLKHGVDHATELANAFPRLTGSSFQWLKQRAFPMRMLPSNVDAVELFLQGKGRRRPGEVTSPKADPKAWHVPHPDTGEMPDPDTGKYPPDEWGRDCDPITMKYPPPKEGDENGKPDEDDH
jgi:hypothetical protein